MAADSIAPSITTYLDLGTYPDPETAALELTPEILSQFLKELTRVQDDVKEEVRNLSKATAPEVDTWISRAKELQSDIQKSRDTARAIVEEAEAVKAVKAEAEDSRQNAQFLEKELAFNEALADILEQVRYTDGLLDEAQEAAVQSDIEKALIQLEDVEASMTRLKGLEGSRVYQLLRERAKQRKDNIAEITTARWNSVIAVSQENRKIAVTHATSAKIGLAGLTGAAKSLGIFPELISKLTKDLERAIFRPRLTVDDHDQVFRIAVDGDELSCKAKSHDTSFRALFEDLATVLDFLDAKLTPLRRDVSEVLLPLVTKRLEEYWLEPAVPLGVSDMPQFHELLEDVSGFADRIDALQWHGAKEPRSWVQNAPKIWLTKRREAILGDTRNLVFTGLKSTRVEERIETQIIKGDDALANTGTDEGVTAKDGEDDDWGAAWGESEEPDSPTRTSEPENHDTPADDEDLSAWDTEDTGDKADKAPDGEEEAWGWGDDDAAGKANGAVLPKTNDGHKMNGKPELGAQPAEREVTLREKFTVTAVPSTLMAILESIVSDAQILSEPEFSSSPIAPAASALYTLPTLSLAIYRATAPTAYAKLETGNMLIYNDASHLASLLRDWQTSQHPASRLRVDNDVKALETFAKRAYSSEMESQRTILRDLLDGAQGFSNCTVHPYKQECEGAVDQTVHRIREVYRQWKDILSQGALLQSLGSLLSTVIAKMVSEIEDLGDIGEADSHQLTALCRKVAEVKDLFLQAKPSVEPDQQQEAADMTFIYCPNWLKFQYLGEILESNLAEIKYLWNEGELSLEFEAEEVIDLITALFAESDLRKRAVAELKRHGRK